MTRLVPTRDRAQATRFTFERVRNLSIAPMVKNWVRGFNDDEWVAELFPPYTGADMVDAFWSGPWYVREVAE